MAPIAWRSPMGVPCSHRSVSAGNMMLFGPDGLIKRYETPQDILLEFFDVRMQFYHKRHAFLIQVQPSQYTSRK